MPATSKPRMAGNSTGKICARFAAAHLPVDGVDARGVDLDEHLVGASGGSGYVFNVQVGGRTVCVQDNSFHGLPLTDEMRELAVSLLRCDYRAGPGQ